MSSKELEGRWALVTGASSGLGVCFARELAQRGANCILVARRKDKLEEVAEELRKDTGVEVDVVVLDLGTRDAPPSLLEQLEESGREVDILVNNAGFGLHGLCREIPWEKARAMLDLDIMALTHLTRLFSEKMVERGWGRILQIASIGAYQPCPGYAEYGAAKSYVLHFGEALNHELKGTGVSCTVLSPGVTATEFFEVSGQGEKLSSYQRMFMMQADKVARIGIKAMLRGRGSIIPGVLNSFNSWTFRFVPRGLAPAISAATMKTE